MKPKQSLRVGQRAMRRRQRFPSAAGRPPLRIDEDLITELLLRGYSFRGVAIHLGCAERTLRRRFPHLLHAALDLKSLSGRLLFRLAVEQNDSRALRYLARKSGLCRDRDEEFIS